MLSESKTAGAATCPHMTQSRPSCLAAPPSALDEELAAEAAVSNWLSSGDANDFPYAAVVAEFHRVGKHFVATELLEALADVRANLPEMRGSDMSVRLLDRFLDAALDKWDGRY